VLRNLPSVKGIEGIPRETSTNTYSPLTTRVPNDACLHRYDSPPPRRFMLFVAWHLPNACMEDHGKQIIPILRAILERGGVHNIRPNGRYFERAITRARL
jgi:hypothetical protein